MRGDVITSPLEDKELERFVSLSDAYDLGLRRTAYLAWEHINDNFTRKLDHFDRMEMSPDVNNDLRGRNLHEGVYAYVGGPKYVMIKHVENH